MQYRMLFLLIAVTSLTLFSGDVFACATCFGNEDDTQTHGLNGAIITMLGVTYTLFTSMAVAGVVLWRRNQRTIAALENNQISPDTAEEIPHV
jgi:hypothetical protein